MLKFFKELQKKWNQSSLEDKLSCLIMLLAIVGVLVLFGFFIWKYAGMLLAVIALLVIVFCDEIERWLMKKRNTGTNGICADCPGCDAMYDVTLKIVFQAARLCEAVGIRPPRSPQELVTNYQMKDNNCVCCYLILFRATGSAQDSHSVDTVREFLAMRIRDTCLSNEHLFYGTPVQGLYLDSVAEQDEFSYMIRILPVCPCNSGYLKHREKRAWFQKGQDTLTREKAEPFYDDEL